MAPAVVDHGEVEQQAQAVDQLPQARQQVGEADADAVFGSLAADAVEGGVALVEQHVDVADLVRIRHCAAAAGALQQGQERSVLCQERRFMKFQVRLGAQQFPVEAHPGDAVGEHARGFQQAGERRAAGADFCQSERAGQLQPGIVGDGRHPQVVVTLIEQQVEDVAQPAFVAQRRQQALAQALRQFQPEAQRRAHAGFGIEGALAGQGQHGAQGLAERGRLLGPGAKARDFGAHPWLRILRSGRTQPVHQRLEDGDGGAVRRGAVGHARFAGSIVAAVVRLAAGAMLTCLPPPARGRRSCSWHRSPVRRRRPSLRCR